ncbi:MAG: hypothetical protein KGM47_03065 [Acidobacteriota bacterium]|nr:hypothetical protein [Acidobacteriota bacterium]
MASSHPRFATVSDIIHSMPPEFDLIAFKDPAKAEANLGRIEGRLPPELHRPLASLLSESPDPDGALNLLERYTSKASAEILAELAVYPTALTYLSAIFSYSSFLSEAFLSDPGLPLQFARDRSFSKLKSKEDLMQDYARLSTAAPDPWLSAQLGRFKRRTELRIVLKDVLHISTLAETTRELSELADVVVSNALAHCDQELRKRYGEPQFRDRDGRIARSEFSVISLGKMGGNELNYSSDIDLLYLYSRNGETSGGSEPDSVIANKEYFVRLANAITGSLTQATPFGPAYRVDLRLRPEGDMGDMTISLKSALEYYERRARDWELQMLIKARHSAGDEKLTREFLRAVEGRIYGATADFAAIETILLSRERISRKLRTARAETIDVKLHPGGIRSIEFLTQCLQRLYGGSDAWVRSGGTLLALRKLNDKGCLSDKDYAALTTAYEFLRKVEHRIQLDRGQQTHRLPADSASLDKLALRAGIEKDRARAERPEDQTDYEGRLGDALIARLEETFKRVDEIYQKVIHPRATASLRGDYALEPPPNPMPEQAGASYESALAFLNVHAPGLAEIVAAAQIPDRAQKNAGRFLGSLLGSAATFELASNHPDKLTQALEMIACSDYLAGLLIHHPGDILALSSLTAFSAEGQMEMDLGQSTPNGGVRTRAAVVPCSWTAVANGGLRTQMALLRQHYRLQTLALSGRDLRAGERIFDSLAGWSSLASESISTALEIALRAAGQGVGIREKTGFAILGMGRLGIAEFDLASDADLIFVVASGTSAEVIEAWTRVAEKIIAVLSSYTGDGTLFPVDTRLRPRGQEGELVVTADALLAYASEHAQVWEAMAYLKALFIAGDCELGCQVTKLLGQRLSERFASNPQLDDDLRQMRRRLERELASTPSDLKTAPGSYYDVDYATAYLQLRHGPAISPGSNTAERIGALSSAGLLPDADARVLTQGAAFLRAADHAIRLVTGKSSRGIPEHTGHAAMIEDLAGRWGLLHTPDGDKPLEHRLREVQGNVRRVYRRVVGSD